MIGRPPAGGQVKSKRRSAGDLTNANPPPTDSNAWEVHASCSLAAKP